MPKTATGFEAKECCIFHAYIHHQGGGIMAKPNAIYCSISALGAAFALNLLTGIYCQTLAQTNSQHLSAAALTPTASVQSSDLKLPSELENAKLFANTVSEVSFRTRHSHLLRSSTAQTLVLSNYSLNLTPTNLKLSCATLVADFTCDASPSSNSISNIYSLAPETTLKDSVQMVKQPKSRTGFSLAPSIATTGTGLELTKSIVPHFNARVGVNLLDVGFNNQIRDIDYKSRINLLNVSALGDIYPWKKSGFHLTAGVVYSDNTLNGTGKPVGGTYSFGGNTYQVNDVGTLKTQVKYPSNVAPYIGLGWGNPVGFKKRLSVNINAGIMFTGSPQAEVTAFPNPTLPMAVQDQIRSDIQKEQNQIQNTLNDFSIYPVISVSLSYQF
jgi:hypothetical protein